MAIDLQQSHFRFRTDGDAADATPTWGADEDANYDPGVSPFRLRMGLANLGDASSGSLALYLQKNAGSYAAITTSSTGGVQSYDASSDADDTPIRIPRLSMSAEWRLAGAAIDLDLEGNRIYPSGAFADYLSCSRAGDGYARNSSGEWVQFSSNVLRITDLGLLVEDGRTNYLINSATPATQETGSLTTGDYTLWVEGSGSAIASNGSGTISGAESATDGSPSIFTVTVAGTVNVTVTGSLDRFQLEKGGFGSSYIPTGATSAARAADVVTVIGDADTLLSTQPGTLLVDHKFIVNSQGAGVSWTVVGDSGGTEAQLLGIDDSNHEIVTNCGGSLVATVGGLRHSVDGIKSAHAWSSAARSLVASGGTVTTSGAGFGGASGFTSIVVGYEILAIKRAYGYFRRITMWDSKLDDATLQSLTSP